LLWQGSLISLDGKFRIDSSMQQQRDQVTERAEWARILILQSAGDDSEENLTTLSTQCIR